MNSFKILNEKDFINTVVEVLKFYSFTNEEIYYYISLIVCGLEIFKHFCIDYEDHISNIYSLYFTVIYKHIINNKKIIKLCDK